jgi:hypothetical protein
MRTARRQQRLGSPRMFLQPFVALLIELPIATNATAFDSRSHILNFGTDKWRLVKRNANAHKTLTPLI